MINITNLSKSYGSRVLFDDLSLRINRGEKIGLIGPNGAGKTTFFSLILGKTEVSSGSISVNKKARIGYLAQESSFSSDRTVLLELTEGDELILKLKREKETLELENKASFPRYGEVLHELEVFGYFELEYKAKKILMGLGFKEQDFSRPIKELSGGWQMRTLLAKLLTCPYDILLLDEPTNYLDLNAALWFKDYLVGFSGTFIMISHDKAFLDEVANYTLVLENAAMVKIKGNYEQYLRILEEKRVCALKQFKEQDKKKEQLKKFVNRFHAQPNKAAQVRAKRRVLEKMEEIIVPADRRESIRKFRFPQTKTSGYRVAALERISKSYGDIKVYQDFDFEIVKGEKGVLVGENGAGKSTLLKILAGVSEIDSGRRILGHNVDIGYFSQTRMDVLTPYNTVLEEAYSAVCGDMSLEAVRTILGAFLFSGDDVGKSVKVLSGGEKSRLILAKLLINPPNFLLLDEPTTHLDIDAVEALIRSLKAFEGTMVVISHDIYFVRSVANVIFDVKHGTVRKFPGNFDYYMERKKKGELYDEINENRQKGDFLSCGGKDGKEIFPGEGVDTQNYNAELADKVTKLRTRKEKLQLEKYAVMRVLSNPRHSRDTVKEYDDKLKRIENKIYTLDNKIKDLKTKFV